MAADDALVELARTWPGQPWTWDGRFNAFASSFGAEVEPRARDAVARALPQQWTSATLAQAPDALRAVCSRTGGLRAGQLLFAGATFDGVTPFGLWWPWGGAQTVTLRLGFSGADAAMMLRLKGMFAVPG